MKELLISTDVDEIIERIKERRSIRLKELAASLSMDQREVRKWAEVLESQGLISIDHQLTQEILTWTEKQAKKINHDATFEVEAIKQPVEIIEIAKGEPEQQEKAPVAPIISEKPALQMEEKEAWRRLPGMKEKQPESKIFEEDELFGSRQPKEQDTDNKTKEAELQAPKVTQDFELEEKKVQQVQEMRAKEVPRAKPEKKAQAAKQLAREKEKIQKAIKAEKKAKRVIMAKATVAKPKSPMHKTREKIRRGEIQEKRPEVGIEEEQKQLERVWEQQTGGEIRPRLKPQRQITSLGEMLSQQLEEIKQQSERITQLRREKSKLLHGIYEPLANRMQSEIETVSEKLVEKESLILELERRAAQVPQLAQEVDTKQAKVLELERQAKGSLENAKIEVEDLLSSLEKLGQQAAQSMEDAQKEISASSVKLEQIGKTASKVDSLIGQTEQQIQQTKELIANQTESISQIEEAAASLGQYRSALEADMKQVKNYIERQRGIAKGLSAQIDTLSQVDGWVRQHLEDYERQVEELSKVTEQNEADFAKLREAVETNFVRRYISELQKLSSGHEFEINKAIETESALDARIAAEKSRLENLVRESKEIVAILQDESLKQADQQKILQQVLESKKKKLEELEPAAQKAQELKMALDAITFGTDKVSMQSGERKPSKKK